MEQRVVLTGFMGTGKSTVGRLLAERLGYEFVDTDEAIEASHGPIPEIFEKQGEAGFRRIEHELTERLARRLGVVVSTGGGLMVDPANASLLGNPPARVFCLVASPDTILARVAESSTERPLLAERDQRGTIDDLLASRADAYGRFEQVDTEGRTPDDVADEIVRELGRSSRTPR